MILNRIKICLLLMSAAITFSCGGTDMWSKAVDVGVPCYGVMYNANNSSYTDEVLSGTLPVDAAYYKTGDSASVLAAGDLSLTHYHFSGWNTASDGSGDTYAAGDTMVMENQNVTLYAIWIVNQYTVTYNANGATGGTVPASVTQNYKTTVTIEDNTGNLVLIPDAGSAEAFKFGGWNTRADGNGTTFQPGVSGPLTQSVTLYVLWVPFVIGETGPAGGLIFYDQGSYSSGWRYLEAAPSDQSIGIVWNDGTDITTGASGTAAGTGSTNTASIISVQSNTASYAANVCSGTISGYSDWFLPSIDELIAMYSNLNSLTGSGFASAVYWSSSEVDSSNAQAFDFGTGLIVTPKPKNENAYVRPVRAF